MNGSVIAALIAAALIMIYLAWKKRSTAPKPEDTTAQPELPPQTPASAPPEALAAAEESPGLTAEAADAQAATPKTPDIETESPGPVEDIVATLPTASALERRVEDAAPQPMADREPGSAQKTPAIEAPAEELELAPERLIMEVASEPGTIVAAAEPEGAAAVVEPEPVGGDTLAPAASDPEPVVEEVAIDVAAAIAVDPLGDDQAEPPPAPELEEATASTAHGQEPLVAPEPERAHAHRQSMAPSEPAPPQAAVSAMEKDASVLDELLAEPAPTATSALPMVHLTLEAYSEQLNALEERQRERLAEAIVQRDDGLRDRLQRELVLLNDRLALIADSYVEELACYQQVLELLSQLRKEQGEVPGLPQAMAAVQEGKTAAAEELLAQLSRQPSPFAVRAAFGSGRLAECRGDLQQALGLYRQAVTQEPENTVFLLAAGRIARHLYHYTEALSWLESLVTMTRKTSASDPLPLALAERELAYTYVLSGQYHKAGPLYKEAMTALAKKLGQDHPEMAISWQQIGELQETLGEYDKAVSLYKKALQILEQKRGPEHPALASILARLAALCMELELEKEAVPLFERLVRIREKALRPTHPQMAVALNGLAEAYRLQGRYAEAETCYQKILTIHEATHGPEHPSVAAVLQELAKLATNQRKPEEAQRYQERASAIFQKSVEAAEQQSGKQALTLEL